MYLLIGGEHDECCAGVRAALEERGCEARIVPSAMAEPLSSSWRLDSRSSTSTLRWADGASLTSDEIDGVLLRGPALIDPAGGKPTGASYACAEAQAGLLAWLWGLDCPVVDRYPAGIWYRPNAPLLAWRAALWRAGLRTAYTFPGNVAAGARAFGDRMAAPFVYAPLTTAARDAVPECLTPVHDAAQAACVVGEQVVWNGPPPAGAERTDAALRAFAQSLGLGVLQAAFASGGGELHVVELDFFLNIERFDPAARGEIIAGLVELLRADGHGSQRSGARFARSWCAAVRPTWSPNGSARASGLRTPP